MDAEKLTELIKDEIKKHDLSAREYSRETTAEFANLIMGELKRVDLNHRDVLSVLEKMRDEQIDQGKTLIRNTESLEYHIKRTDILQNKVEHVENEVDGLKSHVEKVNFILQILKPTKDKIKWLIILSTLLSGSYTLSDKDNINTILKLFGVSITKEAIPEVK